jgi:long-chain fatty acid transport protein
MDAIRSNSLGSPYRLAVAGALFLPGAPVLNQYDFSQDEIGHGYRIGAAYEIPGIALRANVIYDSGVDMKMSGTQRFFDASGNSLIGPLGLIPVSTELTLPQSVTARIQSAVNETTLVWVGVKWQNWGSIQKLDITAHSPSPAANASLAKSLSTGWSDGYTIEAGVGKKLSDQLSVSGKITWNQGIGGGYTDTWSFGTGAAITVSENVKFNLGASATLLTSSKEKDSGGGGGVEEVTYKQGNDWAYAAGAQIVISFD